MSSNKSVKERMIRYYGARCFIEKLHLRKDTEKRKYKSSRQRARMKQLTYHHIQTKKNGGETTVEMVHYYLEKIILGFINKVKKHKHI